MRRASAFGQGFFCPSGQKRACYVLWVKNAYTSQCVPELIKSIRLEHDDKSIKDKVNHSKDSPNSSVQNIQRSSSHESHLRNKIQPPLPVISKNSMLTRDDGNSSSNHVNNCDKTNSSCENIYCSSRAPSGKIKIFCLNHLNDSFLWLIIGNLNLIMLLGLEKDI